MGFIKKLNGDEIEVVPHALNSIGIMALPQDQLEDMISLPDKISIKLLYSTHVI